MYLVLIGFSPIFTLMTPKLIANNNKKSWWLLCSRETISDEFSQGKLRQQFPFGSLHSCGVFFTVKPQFKWRQISTGCCRPVTQSLRILLVWNIYFLSLPSQRHSFVGYQRDGSWEKIKNVTESNQTKQTNKNNGRNVLSKQVFWAKKK